MRKKSWQIHPSLPCDAAGPKVLLLYGSNVGLITYWVRELAAAVPFQTVDESSFFENQETFLTPTLFGPAQSHFCLLDATDRKLKAYEQLLQIPPAFFLLIGPKLRSTSSLVKLLTQSPAGIAVPCYEIGEKEMGSLVQYTAARFGLTLPALLIQRLCQMCAPEILESQLKLLSLYKEPGTTSLSEMDLVCCLSGYNKNSTDLACLLSAGKIQELGAHLTQGVDEPLGLIRQTFHYFFNLLRVRLGLDSGQSFTTAAQSAKPPIFFKDLPAFQEAAAFWTPDSLKKALFLLTRAEIALKTSGPRCLWENLLFQVAQLKSPKGGAFG